MDYTKELEQRNLSLCTGSGGLERGIEKVLYRLRTVAYVEIEAFQIFNLVSAMEAGLVDQAPIWSNIKTFDAQPFRGRIHSITAGYPCQPFSLAGQRKGDDDPRHLWPYIEKITETVKPVWCFFENVAGHLSLGFDDVYRSLHKMGYRVEAGLYTAAETGAPHIRKRLFILACTDPHQLWRCVADTYGQRRGIPNQQRSSAPSATNGSNLLGNATKQRLQGQRKPRNTSKTNEQKGRGEFGRTGANNDLLPNTNSSGNTKSCTQQQTKKPHKNGQEWPAKPGQPQFEWEAPRTTQPGMGSTVNGYNFRTELLRMYGNGVVPQTAELAFYELLKKMIK